MERNEILQRLTLIMRTVFKDDNLCVSEETELQSIEAWDSLLNMQLLVSIEKEFGFRFKLSELGRLTSVVNIIDIISAKL